VIPEAYNNSEVDVNDSGFVLLDQMVYKVCDRARRSSHSLHAY
jgi:hypothetical protein